MKNINELIISALYGLVKRTTSLGWRRKIPDFHLPVAEVVRIRGEGHTPELSRVRLHGLMDRGRL